ncbi:MAG: phosphatidylglycerophosphatase A [Rhodospirillaceae bacterium]|nr:phosphatidylglycerophosphatase A [Rhodospirillaceae bacterium]
MKNSRISDQKPKSFEPVSLISTCIGIGYLPFAPGTWGSLAALPICWLVLLHGSRGLLLLTAIVLFYIGVIITNFFERRCDNSDPGCIVIDEFVGQMLVLCVASPDLIQFILGFILFRIMDIFKPWPVSMVDKNIKGGFGIMLDDVVAAVYAAIVLYCFIWIMSH